MHKNHSAAPFDVDDVGGIIWHSWQVALKMTASLSGLFQQPLLCRSYIRVRNSNKLIQFLETPVIIIIAAAYNFVTPFCFKCVWPTHKRICV